MLILENETLVGMVSTFDLIRVLAVLPTIEMPSQPTATSTTERSYSH